MRPRTARTLLLDAQKVGDDLLPHYRRLGARAPVRKVAGSQLVDASRLQPLRLAPLVPVRNTGGTRRCIRPVA
jgi:hypothetical protein